MGEIAEAGFEMIPGDDPVVADSAQVDFSTTAARRDEAGFSNNVGDDIVGDNPPEVVNDVDAFVNPRGDLPDSIGEHSKKLAEAFANISVPRPYVVGNTESHIGVRWWNAVGNSLTNNESLDVTKVTTTYRTYYDGVVMGFLNCKVNYINKASVEGDGLWAQRAETQTIIKLDKGQFSFPYQRIDANLTGGEAVSVSNEYTTLATVGGIGDAAKPLIQALRVKPDTSSWSGKTAFLLYTWLMGEGIPAAKFSAISLFLKAYAYRNTVIAPVDSGGCDNVSLSCTTDVSGIAGGVFPLDVHANKAKHKIALPGKSVFMSYITADRLIPWLQGGPFLNRASVASTEIDKSVFFIPFSPEVARNAEAVNLLMLYHLSYPFVIHEREGGIRDQNGPLYGAKVTGAKDKPLKGKYYFSTSMLHIPGVMPESNKPIYFIFVNPNFTPGQESLWYYNESGERNSITINVDWTDATPALNFFVSSLSTSVKFLRRGFGLLAKCGYQYTKQDHENVLKIVMCSCAYIYPPALIDNCIFDEKGELVETVVYSYTSPRYVAERFNNDEYIATEEWASHNPFWCINNPFDFKLRPLYTNVNDLPVSGDPEDPELKFAYKYIAQDMAVIQINRLNTIIPLASSLGIIDYSDAPRHTEIYDGLSEAMVLRSSCNKLIEPISKYLYEVEVPWLVVFQMASGYDLAGENISRTIRNWLSKLDDVMSDSSPLLAWRISFGGDVRVGMDGLQSWNKVRKLTTWHYTSNWSINLMPVSRWRDPPVNKLWSSETIDLESFMRKRKAMPIYSPENGLRNVYFLTISDCESERMDSIGMFQNLGLVTSWDETHENTALWLKLGVNTNVTTKYPLSLMYERMYNIGRRVSALLFDGDIPNFGTASRYITIERDVFPMYMGLRPPSCNMTMTVQFSMIYQGPDNVIKEGPRQWWRHIFTPGLIAENSKMRLVPRLPLSTVLKSRRG